MLKIGQVGKRGADYDAVLQAAGRTWMKITVEIDDSLSEEEITIRCRELNAEVIAMQKCISEAVMAEMQLCVTKGDMEYYLPISEIYFFETADSAVAVHTRSRIYETKRKLYELEEMLPGSFLRVSKSAILNTRQIRAIHKNIAGASEVEFAGTNKRAFVSRSYYKLLADKMAEKRLKK